MMAVFPNEQITELRSEMKIGDLIKETTVFFLEEQYKEDVLDVLVQKAFDCGFVSDVAAFKAAIDAREAICTTAMGDEIAFPHAKSEAVSEFFVLTARLRCGVEWDAPDQRPVRIVMLIGGTQNDQPTYLGLLGKILMSVKSVDRKERIFSAMRPAEIASILTR